MPKPRVFEIRLLVETDDPEVVAQLADAVARLACPADDFSDHACAVPWFVISAEVEDADAVRDLLNR